MVRVTCDCQFNILFNEKESCIAVINIFSCIGLFVPSKNMLCSRLEPTIACNNEYSPFKASRWGEMNPGKENMVEPSCSRPLDSDVTVFGHA